MKSVFEIRHEIEKSTPRSAWGKGVKEYALELLDTIEGGGAFSSVTELTKALLNGAENWVEYSLGGMPLAYDEDIARRVCTPTEWVRTLKGTRGPNRQESWIDVQARALTQAANLIVKIAKSKT